MGRGGNSSHGPEFAGAAVTTRHRPGGLNHTRSLSPSSGSPRPRCEQAWFLPYVQESDISRFSFWKEYSGWQGGNGNTDRGSGKMEMKSLEASRPPEVQAMQPPHGARVRSTAIWLFLLKTHSPVTQCKPLPLPAARSQLVHVDSLSNCSSRFPGWA